MLGHGRVGQDYSDYSAHTRGRLAHLYYIFLCSYLIVLSRETHSLQLSRISENFLRRNVFAFGFRFEIC